MRRTGSAASTRRPQPSTAGWVTSGTLAGMPVNNIPARRPQRVRPGQARDGPGQPGTPVPAPPSLLRAGPGAHHPRPHRQRQLEEELALQRTALPGAAAPRRKTTFRCSPTSPGRGCDPAESPPVQTPFWIRPAGCSPLPPRWTASYSLREKVSLLQILEQIRRYMLPTPSALRPPCHHPRGRRGRHCVRGLRLLSGPGGQRAGARTP